VWERIPCDLESSCQPITAREGGTGWDARVQDISLGGVAVVLRRRFEPGSGLSIGLPAAGAYPPLTLLVRVMRTERLSDGQWLLGCSFPSPLGEEEMQGLLARARPEAAPAREAPAVEAAPPAATPPPKRALRTPPLKVGPKGRLIPSILFEGRTTEGVSVRVWVRRLFLTGGWPPAEGTLLRLWVGDRTTYPHGIQVRITDCERREGHWAVQYEFVTQPPPELLNQLSDPGLPASSRGRPTGR
jgi:hypothetical protein